MSEEKGFRRLTQRLSTQELRELVREDLFIPGEEDAASAAMMDAVLEELACRQEAAGEPEFDVAAGWKALTGQELSPRPAPVKAPAPAPGPRERRRGGAWRIGFAAAVLAGFMSVLVAVQAAGVNVFGTLARWTDETFSAQTASARCAQRLEAALEEGGLPTGLVPGWYPPEFWMGEIRSREQEDLSFTQAHFYSGQRSYVVTTARFAASHGIALGGPELKEGETVEEYETGGRRFTVVSGPEGGWAYWTDGRELAFYITGDLPRADVCRMVDSIG